MTKAIEVDLGPGEAREVDLVTQPLKVWRKWTCPSPTKYVVLVSMSQWRRSFMRVPVLKGRIEHETNSVSGMTSV